MTNEEHEKRDELCELIFKTHYDLLSVVLRKTIGLKQALFFAYLLNWERYFIEKNALPNDRFFWRRSEDIDYDLGLSATVRQKIQTQLVKFGIISVELRKTPKTDNQKSNYYRVNYEKAIRYIALNADAKPLKRRLKDHSKGTDATIQKEGYDHSKGLDMTVQKEPLIIHPVLNPTDNSTGIILKEEPSVLVPEKNEEIQTVTKNVPSAKNADGSPVSAEERTSERRNLYVSALDEEWLNSVEQAQPQDNITAHVLEPVGVVRRFDWDSIQLENPRKARKAMNVKITDCT
jgi:hypothetical protein